MALVETVVQHVEKKLQCTQIGNCVGLLRHIYNLLIKLVYELPCECSQR